MKASIIRQQMPGTVKRPVGKYIFIIFVAVAVLVAAIYAWALLSTGTSLLARGIVWGDSDVGDWQRFPPRLIHASSDKLNFSQANPIIFPEKMIEDQGTKYSIEEYLEQSNSTAFIIIHNNELLYEGYFNGSNRETPQASMSITKSFLSTLVGIAIEEGFIKSLDDPVTVYIPELAERDSDFSRISLRHLITMASGIRFERKENGIDDGMITYYSPDLRKAALESQIASSPGERFLYNDYNPLLIGMVLERSTGMSMSEYMETRLWQPMGAEGDATWSLDSEEAGFEKASAGLNARAIDIAKLGWLFLNKGKNGEQQVVPENWVQESTAVSTRSDPSPNYQYYWWVSQKSNAFWAEGDYCQYVYVDPEAQIVIVRTGQNCGDKPNFGPEFLYNLTAWLETQLE